MTSSRGGRRERPSDEHWYTLADTADPATVRAAYRGALIAQRPRLRHVDVDLVSDGPWPDEVQGALRRGTRLLEQRRRARLVRWLPKASSITLRVDPRDDGAFAVAVALAPYTVGGTGLDARSRIVWSGNDTGTSAAFRLVGTELAQVRSAIASGGGDPGMLVPLQGSP